MMPFGFVGFVSSAMLGAERRTYLFYKPMAIFDSVEIEVDKDGVIAELRFQDSPFPFNDSILQSSTPLPNLVIVGCKNMLQ